MSLSVIIPLYNRAATIQRTVDSVLAQLGPGDELLVVDDGSTDDGPTRLAADRGAALRLLHQPNRGAATARNHGAQEARNDRIAFLDADDYWLPGARAAWADLMATWPDADLWSLGHARVEGHAVAPVDPGLPGPACLTGLDWLRHYTRYSGLLNASSTALRRAAFEARGGFPEGEDNGEDVCLWLALALHHARFAIDPAVHIHIDRAVSGHLPSRARRPVPAHLRYYTERTTWRALPREERRTLRRFLRSNGLRHAAGNILRGPRRDGLAIARRLARIDLPGAAGAGLVSLLPRPWLRAAYRRRQPAEATRP